MSEPTYTVILTDSERRAIAHGMSLLVEKLVNAPIFVEAPSGGTQHARAVLSPPAPDPAVAPSPTPVELRDRWARNRKGVEVPMPEGYVAREVVIWKAEQRAAKKAGGPPYLKLTWQSQGQGHVDANCFDAQLFPWILKQQAAGTKTTLYLVKSGDYLNVVGVRA